MAVPQNRSTPLTRSSKWLLMGTSAVVIAVCYLYALLWVCGLLVLMACEAMIGLVAARVGMSGFFFNFIAAQSPLLKAFVGSFWMSGGGENKQQTIQREDAPRLFAKLDELAAKLGIAVPQEVFMTMEVNAWVRLHGFRPGKGKTLLGVGFDLMAGLTEAEFDAVLAHEMAHAKLINRGFKNFGLNAGFGRSVKLTQGLRGYAEAYRQRGKEHWLTEMALGGSHVLTLRLARLHAAYSRQDEFEADYRAAQIVGAGALKSGLRKLAGLSKKVEQLPWSHRVARIEAGMGFSGWLKAQLVNPAVGRIEDEVITDPYSTHPSTEDRIAALPEDTCIEESRTCALDLLLAPDAIAARMVSDIQAAVLRREQEESRELAKVARKQARGSDVRLQQWPGVMMMLGGPVWALILLGQGDAWYWALAVSAAGIAGGLWLYRFFAYKDQMRLGVPAYGVLIAGWKKPEGDLVELQKTLREEMHAAIAGLGTKNRKVRWLVERAYAALQQCDYLPAHVAAVAAIGLDESSVEAVIAYSVASAGLGLNDQAFLNLEFLKKKTGLATGSSSWAIAWVMVLCGEWYQAEIYLEKTHKHWPAEHGVLLLLALAQLNRGKTQMGLANARRARAFQPDNLDYTKVVIGALLDAGSYREAGKLLDGVAEYSERDDVLATQAVRFHLLVGGQSEADAVLEKIRRRTPDAHRLTRLGEAYEHAGVWTTAEELFLAAIGTVTPASTYMGLARVCAQKEDAAGVRENVLHGLKAGRGFSEGGAAGWGFFKQALAMLVQTQVARGDLAGWVVAYYGPKTCVPDLYERELLVYALNPDEARMAVKIVADALADEPSQVQLTMFQVRQASADRQPVGLVRAGVQYVVK